MSIDPLLEPYQLKHLRLRNRIVSTSHEPAYAEEGMPKLRYQLYHEEKAKGGIALTMIGGSANVAIDSPSTFGQLYIGDDAIIPYLRQLADRVHAHGAAVMSQITHMGRRTEWDTANWLPILSSSAQREPAHRSFPKAMEGFDIRRLVHAYGEAARRCRDGGLDGVEVSAYAGHLIDQFLSPRMNRRTDQYGGSLDNRLRFAFEVLAQVRAVVGDGFIVGVRLSLSESVDGGLTADDSIAVGQALADSGLIDFVSVAFGSTTTDAELAQQIPPLGTPLGGYLPLVGAYRTKVGLPLIHAGRIADLPTARHALREGYVDLVGMVRAHIADPHIVRKLEAGEEDRIRPCVGASYCINRIYIGLDSLCLHNPATGREQLIPHIAPPTPEPKRVVVVGAGPAGLEAARACAERGHSVILFEAAGRVGGQVQLAARATERQKELIGIVKWLELEARRLGVDVRLDAFAEANAVQALDPDAVIIATGGLPATPTLSEGDDLTVSTWDILGGEVSPGHRVLVFDDHGSDQALSTTEHLAARGSQVEIVTADRLVGHDLVGTLYPAYLAAFYRAGVRLTPDHRLRGVRRHPDGLVAVLRNEYTGESMQRVVDQVVVEHGTIPNDDVYVDLKDHSINHGETDLDALIQIKPQRLTTNPHGRYQLFRIGDATASRNIHSAIYDARVTFDVTRRLAMTASELAHPGALTSAQSHSADVARMNRRSAGTDACADHHSGRADQSVGVRRGVFGDAAGWPGMPGYGWSERGVCRVHTAQRTGREPASRMFEPEFRALRACLPELFVVSGSGSNDAAEAEVGQGGFDHLGLSRRGPVSPRGWSLPGCLAHSTRASRLRGGAGRTSRTSTPRRSP